MLFPITLAVLLLAVFSSIGNIDFNNLLPMGANGAKSIINGAITGFGMSGEFLFILIFIENLSEKTKITPRVLTYSAIAFAIIVVFLVVFAAIFGEIGRFIQDALTKLTHFSPIIRQNTQVDGIIIIGWIPIVILESAINLYAAAWCLKNIFNIKHFAICVITGILITFAIKLIPSLSVYQMLSIIPNFYAILNLTLEIIIPIILVIYIAVKKSNKGGVKNEQQLQAK